MKRLMNELEKVRLGLGFNQSEMGELLGVGRETYNRWKQDRLYPDTESVTNILGLFKVVEEERPELDIWDDETSWTTKKLMEVVEKDMEDRSNEEISKVKKKADERIQKALEERKK